MTTPLRAYQDRVARGELSRDPVQEHAVLALERLYGELIANGAPPRGWRRKLMHALKVHRSPIKGVYLWGNVGRGKTLLMDLFFASLPFPDKLRQHFHRFMGAVHESLKTIGRHENPLDLVADRLADQARVICFDELAVTDIADAMILGNLFEALFERGVSLVATSNLRPNQLYREGLQRRRFLPAIALLERHTEIVHVEGELDYRLRMLEQADVYQSPAGELADRKLAEWFEAMALGPADRDGQIDVLGRPIAYRRSADGIVWFDFRALCSGPRSQSDYIELARCYHTVLVSDVPRFDVRMEDEARRFIALIDEFYDRRVKLILSAAVQIDALYAGAKLGQEFQRTRSRLQEMRSHDYLAAEHRP